MAEYIPNAKPTEQQPQDLMMDPNLGADPYMNAQMNAQAQNLAMQKEYLEVLKHYTEDDAIPDEVKKSRWAIFGKNLALTFLEEKDMPVIDMFTNILRIDALMNQPAHTLTFEQSHRLDQEQLYLYTQAKRAIGTHQGKVNERTLQVTQIGQQISTQTISGQQKSGSMFAKLRALL